MAIPDGTLALMMTGLSGRCILTAKDMLNKIKQSWGQTAPPQQGPVAPPPPGGHEPARARPPAATASLAERQAMYNATYNGARIDKHLYGLLNTRVRCESGANYELITRPDKATARRFGLAEGRSAMLGKGNYSTSIRLARLADVSADGAAPRYVAVKKIYGNVEAARREFEVHVALASHPAGGSACLVKAHDVALISSGKSYLFLEAVPGPNGRGALDALLGDPTLTHAQKKQLLLSTARDYLTALHALHVRGYCHNDNGAIENFFHDRETGRIVIGDYGHARAIASTRDRLDDLDALGDVFGRMDRAAGQAGVSAPGLAQARTALRSGSMLGEDLLANWHQLISANGVDRQ